MHVILKTWSNGVSVIITESDNDCDDVLEGDLTGSLIRAFGRIADAAGAHIAINPVSPARTQAQHVED